MKPEYYYYKKTTEIPLRYLYDPMVCILLLIWALPYMVKGYERLIKLGVL